MAPDHGRRRRSRPCAPTASHRLRAVGASDGDREAGEGEPQARGCALHEAVVGEGRERAADVVFFASHANDELFERGRSSTAGEAEEGAEHVNVEAHVPELTFSTERAST